MKSPSLRPLRRSAPAVAVVVVAIAVLATHDLPVVGHGGGSHEGVGVSELAAVCLAITATTATAAALLSRPSPWTRTEPAVQAAPRQALSRGAHPVEARAGPARTVVLRL